MKVVVGVDTHKDSQAVIRASAEGYAQAIAAIAEYDDVAWGVEGAGYYGRGLVDALLRNDAVVYEVPGALTKRHRKHASRRGKSDAQDALVIAEVVLRERVRLVPRKGSIARRALCSADWSTSREDCVRRAAKPHHVSD